MAKRKKNKKTHRKHQGGNQNKPTAKENHQSKVKEEKLEVPEALRALCILSFLGFIYCLVQDTSDYFAYANYDQLANSANQEAFELMEDRLNGYEKYDIDVSDEGLGRLATMSIYRTILDVLAAVGTALMFFRIKRGYYLYAVFQALYSIVPFAMFGLGAFAIFGKGLLMIPFVYVALFTTQVKHMNR